MCISSAVEERLVRDGEKEIMQRTVASQVDSIPTMCMRKIVRCVTRFQSLSHLLIFLRFSAHGSSLHYDSYLSLRTIFSAR